MVRKAADFTELHIVIEVYDLVHLNRIMAGLRAKPIVSKVERLFE
ncbi:ACT domain-containing protein [Accumulibacter sp.]|nr:ACT domain-containing protein [Accumulibacter sp.]